MVQRLLFGALVLGLVAMAALSGTALRVEAQQRGPRGNPNRSGATPFARPLVVVGTISALSSTLGTLTVTPAQPANSTAVSLTVTANTAISLDGVPGKGLANLLVGMRAGVVYQTSGGVNNALQVNASDQFHVSGSITALASDGSTLSITLAEPVNSPVVTLTVTTSTAIRFDGVTGKSLTNLAVGMRARAAYQLTSTGNNATRIDASDKFHVDGTLAAVTPSTGSTTAGTVTVTSANGSVVTLNVNLGKGTGTTTVKLDEAAVTSLASLLPGMRVKAHYQLTSTGNNATRIDASDLVRVHGTLTAVTLAAGSTTAGTLTVTPNNGSAVTLNVDLGNGTTVRVNGTTATDLNSLTSGMRVEARYQLTSSGNNASFVKAFR